MYARLNLLNCYLAHTNSDTSALPFDSESHERPRVGPFAAFVPWFGRRFGDGGKSEQPYKSVYGYAGADDYSQRNGASKELFCGADGRLVEAGR